MKPKPDSEVKTTGEEIMAGYTAMPVARDAIVRAIDAALASERAEREELSKAVLLLAAFVRKYRSIETSNEFTSMFTIAAAHGFTYKGDNLHNEYAAIEANPTAAAAVEQAALARVPAAPPEPSQEKRVVEQLQAIFDDTLDDDTIINDRCCAKCGEDVSVRDGLDWSEGDWCWECWQTAGQNAREVLAAFAAMKEKTQ